ncbi:MAG: hypothetical protein GY754_06445 [bacterium]|nr:hypothetical protein [bacterium]
MAAKKTSAKKKTAAKKTAAKANPQVAELQKQLKTIIKDLNEEGLLYLIRQAQVLQYNMQVSKLNNEKQKKGLSGPLGSQLPQADKSKMEVKEADDGSSFILVIGRARNFFSLEEMRKLVKLCHAAQDDKDASNRLFTWFDKNRPDVLRDTDIDSPNDQALATMYKGIVKRYKVKS